MAMKVSLVADGEVVWTLVYANNRPIVLHQGGVTSQVTPGEAAQIRLAGYQVGGSVQQSG